MMEKSHQKCLATKEVSPTQSPNIMLGYFGLLNMVKSADSVHRLASPSESHNIFYSASESGLLKRFDTRESGPQVVFHMSRYQHSRDLGIYSVDINPRDSNYIAVGAQDPVVRVFDVRYPLKPCARYCAGHLRKKGMSVNNSEYLHPYQSEV